MNDLEAIKSKIDIVSFLSEYIQLKKAGRNFKALCPFHSEKTPSFIVSPDRQTWHCFGACSQGGDIFDFLVKWENIEFVESIKLLAKKAGVTLSSYQPTEGVKVKERLYEINHLASEFYHFLLSSHKLGQKAREYLHERGINDKISNTFSLGYAPNSWDSILKFLKKKNYTEEEIISSGLVIKTDRNTLYDRFRGRVMFTLKDHRANYVGFSGRKIGADSDKEAKYINTPETPVYIKGNILYGLDQTAHFIRREKEAVVVEGEFDFLSSYKIGTTNVVAIKGSAFTEGQVRLLSRYTENVLLALDSDFAGREAAKKGIVAAENSGLFLKVVKLPLGKDPDECIRKDPSLWKKSLKNAVNIYDFVISKALENYAPESVSSKKKIGDEVTPFISKISNPIILSHYIKLLAKALDVSEEAIATLVEKNKKGQDIPKEQPTQTEPKKRDELLEEHLLSLLLHSPNPPKALEEIFATLELSDFYTPPIATIFEKLQKYSKTHSTLDVRLFTKALPKEVLPTFDKAYLIDLDSFTKDSGIFQKELKKIVYYIKKISLRRRINSLTTKMRKTNDRGAANLQIDIKNLLSQLGELEKMTL